MPDQNQFWESLDKYRYILDSLPNPVIVTDTVSYTHLDVYKRQILLRFAKS